MMAREVCEVKSKRRFVGCWMQASRTDFPKGVSVSS